MEKRSPSRSAPIGWGEIHRRVEAARIAVEQGRELSSEAKRKLLKARARALAREPDAGKVNVGSIDVVEFLLADERYAIRSTYVSEVYPLKELTLLPCTPPFVLGIISRHGRILSVIDIKKFFDLPEKGITDLNKVVIVGDDRMEFGILADLVLGIRSIPLEDIHEPPAMFAGIRADYLQGVTKEPLVILDAARLLSDERIMIHEETRPEEQPHGGIL